MSERLNLTREEYNEVFGVDLTEEEYRKVMNATADPGELQELSLVDKTTGQVYRFTKVNTLLLNIDGKDMIHIEVKNGFKIDGIVLKAEMFGKQFRIEGKLVVT